MPRAGKTVSHGRLQRLGQLLRAVEDGDDVDAIGFETINQSIRVGDKFTQISIIIRGHNTSGVRMLDKLLRAPRECIDNALSVKRRIVRMAHATPSPCEPID